MSIINIIRDWKDRFFHKTQEEPDEKPFFKNLDEYPDTSGFTGGISPTAWDDMELEESVSFASVNPEKPEPDNLCEYNPLYPESVDEILHSGNPEPERLPDPDEFSDEVQIITPRPKPAKMPVLPNYFNM